MALVGPLATAVAVGRAASVPCATRTSVSARTDSRASRAHIGGLGQRTRLASQLAASNKPSCRVCAAVALRRVDASAASQLLRVREKLEQVEVRQVRQVRWHVPVVRHQQHIVARLLGRLAAEPVAGVAQHSQP